jgi:hypothetical protein
MRRRWIPFAVILTLLTGCDNVAWGGIDVRLEGPSAPPAVYSSQAGDSTESVELPSLPTGPVLLAGVRSGDSAHLTVVGMVAGSGLEAFPSEDETPGFRDHFSRTLLARGTELILFAEGVRVGRMTVTDRGTDESLCVARPTVDGLVELLPAAGEVERLLALRDTGALSRPFGAYAPVGLPDPRSATLALGSAAIADSGAPWPPSLTGARADIQGFRLAGQLGDFAAITFLFGDQLAVGDPTDPGAYSLFVIGQQDPAGWTPGYVRYRRADEPTGKGAPRLFGHLDWNGDGTPEALLEVFGRRTRWFASVGLEGGRWVGTFEDPCGLAPAG